MKRWAVGHQEVSPFPAKPTHVALYLSYLTQKAKTATPLEEAVSALLWAHCMATVENVTCHPLVVQVLAGAKKLLAHKAKKEPLRPDHLAALVENFGTKDASLADIRALTFRLLGFAGFLRFDELSKLRICDITMSEDYSSSSLAKLIS